MRSLQKLIICIALLSQFCLADLCNTTDTDDCATCCKGDTDGSKVCITDILKCPLNPSTDFGVLVTILIIIASFVIGIPIVLFIIDKILCSKIPSCKMSFCECLANYVCCWCCLSREKPPVEFEDIEEQENLDTNKKKQTAKITPEAK